MVEQRCAGNSLLGRPAKIDTVDKYQGQQNDYILLSLVRTRQVGHLRDVRRLVVAMSRARLGLYVFGRTSLFANCFELTPAFRLLTQRPAQLQLLPNETHPTERPLSSGDGASVEPLVIQDMPHMAAFVTEFYKTRLHAIANDPNVRIPPPDSGPGF